MNAQEQVAITVTVNGDQIVANVDVRMLASDFLRHQVGLTGTHVGCVHGVCGACTIVVDDAAVRSCLMLAPQLDGCRVETVESLGEADGLGALQRAMWENHGLQCGFCTPGILMTVEAGQRAGRSAAQIIDESLSGHLCRCTGYQNIRTAVEAYFAEGAQA